MPELDLDDNDPLSIFLKKNLKIESTKALSPTKRSMSLLKDNKTDSISDVARQRSQNINHGEIDTEIDKVKETNVSKQMD